MIKNSIIGCLLVLLILTTNFLSTPIQHHGIASKGSPISLDENWKITFKNFAKKHGYDYIVKSDRILILSKTEGYIDQIKTSIVVHKYLDENTASISTHIDWYNKTEHHSSIKEEKDYRKKQYESFLSELNDYQK